MMFRSVLFSLERKLWVGIVLIIVFRSALLTGVAALGTYRAVVLISSVSPREWTLWVRTRSVGVFRSVRFSSYWTCPSNNDNGDLYSALTKISTTHFTIVMYKYKNINQKGQHKTSKKTRNDYNIPIHAFR